MEVPFLQVKGHRFLANQFRLLLASAAYVPMETLPANRDRPRKPPLRETCRLLDNTYVKFHLAETGKCALFWVPILDSGP